MKTHKDLDAWRLSIDLVSEIYKLTQQFPSEEKFGLTNQIRRAAVSVPSNIAEGAARSSIKEYERFLYIALGSLSEVETQLIIALNLEYMNKEEFNIYSQKLDKVLKLLTGLIKFVQNKSKR